MLNQVEMAIEELKHDLASTSETKVSEVIANESPQSILKLEPNIYGIGINLPALCKYVKSWLTKKKS